MIKLKFKTRIKLLISSIGWKIFIWGLEITEDEYFEAIYQQELNNEKNKKDN